MSGIYHVGYADCTSGEPSPGYYFEDDDNELRGPFSSYDAAREAQSPGTLADEADRSYQQKKEDQATGWYDLLAGDDE